MRFLADLLYFAFGLSCKRIKQKSPIMLPRIDIHLHNVLVELFSMLITHFSKVLREYIEVGVKKMNLE